MNRMLAILAFLAASAAPSPAQDWFRAVLDGAQVVPPVSAAAGGWGTLAVNADQSVTYRVETWGLVGTGAHLHLGPPGGSGAAIVTLAGGPAIWSGNSAPLSAAELAAVRLGGSYFDVHSAGFPLGEIRGQILIPPTPFNARADGAQAVPPSNWGININGHLEVNPDRTITYWIWTANLGLEAWIRIGAPGSVGPILFPLPHGTANWNGVTPPMTASEYGIMQRGGTYLEIRDPQNHANVIRGQLLGLGESYGAGCAGGNVTRCLLEAGGYPASSGEVVIWIHGGDPGGQGLLGVSSAPASSLIGSCPRLIGSPNVRSIPVRLDSTGVGLQWLRLPPRLTSRTVYMQFGDYHQGTVNYTSNGWALAIMDV